MSLNELFVLNSSIRLSADMNSWGDQIISQLIKSYPSLSSLVGEVVFAKTDTVKGNALGYITLIGKVQRIPFIVDEYDLNPLDIYIDNGKYLPLSERAVNSLNSRTWPFRLISQTERNGILKTASLFENNGILKAEFVKKNKETFEKIAAEFPEILDNFTNRNIQKATSEFTVRCFIKEAADAKPIVVRDLVSEDKDYKISEFADKFGKDFLTELMSKGEAIVSNMPPKVRLAIDSMEIKGLYKTSENREGYIWHNGTPIAAKRFDHYRMSDLKRSSIAPSIIITECAKYFQDGTLTTKDAGNVPKHKDKVAPQNGDYAVITIGDSCFGPFFINSITKMGADKIYNITTDELKVVNLKTSEDIKTIVQLDENNYLFSQNAQIFKIHVSDIENPKDFIKTASLKVAISKQLDGNFSISDSGVSGIDSNKLKNLKKGDATVVLMHCGLSETDAKYALMRALASNTYSFDAPEKQKVSSDKDVVLEKKAEEIVNYCNENEVLKMAAVSGDKSNVDLALGLNLINYSNIKRFKLIVPEIYTMLDKLCKLLIIKRINRNLFNLDDIQLSQAIRALDEISFALNSL